MHVDSAGNIYIADYYNFKLWKVDAATNIIHVIAGTGLSGSTGNGGLATAATMAPGDVITDDTGNVYIADNGKTRKISIATGIITQFSPTSGLMCFDPGYHYLYVGSVTWIFRQNMATGVIDTIGGTGIAAYNGDGIPATAANLRARDIALDPAGYIYIADDANDRIRMIDAAGIIHTVAGTGASTYNGDNIAATTATIYNPEGLALDKCGNLYIADDGNNRIRKITFDTSCGHGEDTSNHHVGVVNVNGSRLISMYPNPVWGELCVDGLAEPAQYTLYDLTGRQVMTGTLQPGSNKLNMLQLVQGIYTLQVLDGGGGREVWKVWKE